MRRELNPDATSPRARQRVPQFAQTPQGRKPRGAIVPEVNTKNEVLYLSSVACPGWTGTTASVLLPFWKIHGK